MTKLHCPICSTVMGELSSPVPPEQRNYTHQCTNHPNDLRVFAGLGLAGYLSNKEYWSFYIPQELS